MLLARAYYARMYAGARVIADVAELQEVIMQYIYSKNTVDLH